LQFVVIFYNPRKKPQDDDELGGLSSFSLTQEKTHKMTMSRKACHYFLQPKKKPQDNDEPFSLSLSFVIEERTQKTTREACHHLLHI